MAQKPKGGMSMLQISVAVAAGTLLLAGVYASTVPATLTNADLRAARARAAPGSTPVPVHTASSQDEPERVPVRVAIDDDPEVIPPAEKGDADGTGGFGAPMVDPSPIDDLGEGSGDEDGSEGAEE